MDLNLMTYSSQELLDLFSEVLVELRRRGTIRSTNNPVADYAEYLVAEALSLTLAPKSTTGYDAFDAHGRRYEIKGRRSTDGNKSRQLSAIRGLDQQHFSYLAGVLFLENFTVHRACLIPVGIVKQIAVYRSHVNGWIMHLRDSVWAIDGVEDITQSVLEAQRTADRT